MTSSPLPLLSDQQLKSIRNSLNGRHSLWYTLPDAIAHLFTQRRREEFVVLLAVGWPLLAGIMVLVIGVLWVLFQSLLTGQDGVVWWWMVGTTVSIIGSGILILQLPFFQRHYVGFIAVLGTLLIANLLAANMLAINPQLAQEAGYLSMLVVNVLILALRLPLQVGMLAGISALLLATAVALPLGGHPIWSLVLTSYPGTMIITLFVGVIMERQERLNFLQGFLLEHESAERMRLNIMLERLAAEDQLTGLANRRRFNDALHHEWERCQRNAQPVALLFIDVDFFKRYNDRYGHTEGDQCLMAVAQAIKGSLLRPADLAARYGGEEFVVLLPETPQAGAEDVANRIAAHINALAIPHEASTVKPHVTASIGLAVMIPSKHSTSQFLLEAADKALYVAKDEGRNCVRNYQPGMGVEVMV